MTRSTIESATRTAEGSGALDWIWRRQLHRYPDTIPRYGYLLVTVLATIVLYYELYVQGAVVTKIVTDFGFTFTQFVWISVLGNLVGAFGSLAAGLADRWGRANLVVAGLFVTGVIVFAGLPNSSGGPAWIVLFSVLSVTEGIMLVATPALIRDFSPQLGRASAMGFWTMGPVLGSLIVTAVSSRTLDSHPDWRYQFHICGAIGLVVAVIALFGLRELTPRLRDQLMVSLRDRQLIEARAAGIDPEKALHGGVRQFLKLEVVGSAFAISMFLLFYYIAAGLFVVYFVTAFGYTEARANALANWYWGADALILITVGMLSDRLRVRKPFMVIGAIVSFCATAVFATLATRPDTGYYTLAAVMTIGAAGSACAYCAWMAAYTETVEARNPAATATGLAIFGWTVRMIITASLAAFTLVVTAPSTLVDHGPRVGAIAATYPQQIATLSALSPEVRAGLSATPPSEAVFGEAVEELITAKLATDPLSAAARLQQLATQPVPPSDLAYLSAHSADVVKAQKDNPKQWQSWWWVCCLAQLLFIPFIFVMRGRWSPSKARQDAERHEAMVLAGLAELNRVGSARNAHSSYDTSSLFSITASTPIADGGDRR
ncbi:MFS transporter [Nocardia stercoris]|uniref:MFS transporter n=1 Tax=Nocardia stercoris TaxID=2483361 RepID=A0A3M2L1X3_9NOCA|nr:MFS transporter [Nocardia stercoris]RMI30503.1 MFS transporter [Nocardia stercoris]